MHLRIALIGSLIAIVGLAAAWRQAWTRTGELKDALASSARIDPQSTTPATGIPTVEPLRDHDEAAELAERVALLEQARQIPEVARREATLRVILTLKAARGDSPPAPKVLPPPHPKNGGYFPELLDDPEYFALQLESWRSYEGRMTDERMRKLGIPPDVRRQVIDLEFDTYFTSMESERFSGDQAAERQAAIAATSATRSENDTRLRSLLGDEMFDRFKSPEGRDLVSADSHYLQLAMRLSYSDTPLTSDDIARIDAEIKALGSPTRWEDVRQHTAAVDARVRAVLRPEQVAAIDALKAEQEAWTLRSKLPKSSELPRTTRKARLEGGQ